MRDSDEDVAYEIIRQKKLDAASEFDKAAFETRKKAFLLGDWTNASITTQNHQKVGVIVPFSRTVDRDPNPRIPLSIPDLLPVISRREALFWVVIWAAIVGLAYWRVAV